MNILEAKEKKIEFANIQLTALKKLFITYFYIHRGFYFY